MGSYLKQLQRFLKKQRSPRPGLVPQSGDPMHPYRWIRPAGRQGLGRSGGRQSVRRPTSGFDANPLLTGVQDYTNALSENLDYREIARDRLSQSRITELIMDQLPPIDEVAFEFDIDTKDDDAMNALSENMYRAASRTARAIKSG